MRLWLDQISTCQVECLSASIFAPAPSPWHLKQVCEATAIAESGRRWALLHSSRISRSCAATFEISPAAAARFPARRTSAFGGSGICDLIKPFRTPSLSINIACAARNRVKSSRTPSRRRGKTFLHLHEPPLKSIKKSQVDGSAVLYEWLSLNCKCQSPPMPNEQANEVMSAG